MKTSDRRTPRVSVLMPVFNAARYVREAVQSILEQTFYDFELIVVDDGSTDASPTLLRELEALDERIKLSSRPNQGLVATLNEMIGMARGMYLARMDADDIAYPHRFASQVSFLETHPEVVAVGSRALFIDAEGLPLMEVMDHFSHEQIEFALMKPELAMVHPSVMMRAAACRSIGGYRPEYRHAEDLDLFLRLSEIGRLANIPEVLLQYRTHLASVSGTHTDDQRRAAGRAVEHALLRRGVSPSPGAFNDSPPTRSETVGESHAKWAWWALGSKHLKTARKHARLALTAEPLRLSHHRLLACVLRDSFKRVR